MFYGRGRRRRARPRARCSATWSRSPATGVDGGRGAGRVAVRRPAGAADGRDADPLPRQPRRRRQGRACWPRSRRPSPSTTSRSRPCARRVAGDDAPRWSSSPTRATDAALSRDRATRCRSLTSCATCRQRHAGRGRIGVTDARVTPRRGAGVIEEYRDRLPVADGTPVVTLREGGTPLVPAPRLSERHRVRGLPQGRGRQPDRLVQGPRHDRRDLARPSRQGAKAVICASTGNTSRLAAAYAARAGHRACAVLVPAGQDRAGQAGAGDRARRAGAAGRRQLRRLPASWPASWPSDYPVALVNSVNPIRHRRARRPPRSRSSTCSATPPTCTACRSATPATSPRTGWATASTPTSDGDSTRLPAMCGFQAAGAAPIVHGAPVPEPETIATAIRIGNPASWDLADRRPRDDSGGAIDAVTDAADPRRPPAARPREGVFVEPASAAERRRAAARRRRGPAARRPAVVCTVTGHGLKDPEWALAGATGADHRCRPTSTPRRRRRPRPEADHGPCPAPARCASGSRRPAPTSGPGFDCLGLALGLYDDVDGRGHRRRARRRGRRRGCRRRAARRDAPRRAGHARRLRRARRRSRPGCELRCANRIPHGRGLGSSAAAIVAGVWLARALVVGGDARLDDDAALALATELEGHPDNVAACLLGGLDDRLAERGTAAPRRARRRRRRPSRRSCFVPAGRARPPRPARGLLPDDRAARRRRAQRRPGRAAGRALTARPGPAARRRPRTGCTSATARRRCRESLALVDRLRGARACRPSISGAGPTVLVAHQRRRQTPAEAWPTRVGIAAAGWCAAATAHSTWRTAVARALHLASTRASRCRAPRTAGSEPMHRAAVSARLTHQPDPVSARALCRPRQASSPVTCPQSPGEPSRISQLRAHRLSAPAARHHWEGPVVTEHRPSCAARRTSAAHRARGRAIGACPRCCCPSCKVAWRPSGIRAPARCARATWSTAITGRPAAAAPRRRRRSPPRRRHAEQPPSATVAGPRRQPRPPSRRRSTGDGAPSPRRPQDAHGAGSTSRRRRSSERPAATDDHVGPDERPTRPRRRHGRPARGTTASGPTPGRARRRTAGNGDAPQRARPASEATGSSATRPQGDRQQRQPNGAAARPAERPRPNRRRRPAERPARTGQSQNGQQRQPDRQRGRQQPAQPRADRGRRATGSQGAATDTRQPARQPGPRPRPRQPAAAPASAGNEPTRRSARTTSSSRCAGILDMLDNYAFVRTSGYLPGPTTSTSRCPWSASTACARATRSPARSRQPREGERTREVQPAGPPRHASTASTPTQAKRRVEFSKLTPLYPQERLRLETEPRHPDRRGSSTWSRRSARASAA